MRALGPFTLPPIATTFLGTVLERLLYTDKQACASFSEPGGEAALISPDSISWQIFKNPVALFVGGIAAVILELAEPKVRTGIWEHSRFRAQPLLRMRRTGLAAMMTIYGPRSAAVQMIARIVRLHENTEGFTPAGQRYCANDPALLRWVHATATFSFFHAYSRYASALQDGNLDTFCQEGLPAAKLYGAVEVPASSHEIEGLFGATEDNLEASPIIFDFLNIVRHTHILPLFLRPLQGMLVRAAVDIVPHQVRKKVGLARIPELAQWELELVKQLGRASDHIVIRSSPAVQSCLRLGLGERYLYHRRFSGGAQPLCKPIADADR